MPTKEQKFRSVSLSKEDYELFDAARRDFADRNGIDYTKVSMPTILKVAMQFYIQRTKLGMLDEPKKARR